MTLQDLGEKKIIASIIKPMFNAKNNRNLAGDDCAVLHTKRKKICVSTDRVPADLMAFKHGLINYLDLGHYLAVLNISDAVAAGAVPHSLLLNLAFPGNFKIEDLKSILSGVNRACRQYRVQVAGGDLSDAMEMSLSATIIGFTDQPWYRSGIRNNNLIFCSGTMGLTATAFRYFFEARKKGFRLSTREEKKLMEQFSKPFARIDLIRKFYNKKIRVSCMDNTDGTGQSLQELSEINKVEIILNIDLLPIDPVTRKVAAFLGIDPVEIALGPGADFQLIGGLSHTIPQDVLDKLGIHIIGKAITGKGVSLQTGTLKTPVLIHGWNYYI